MTSPRRSTHGNGAPMHRTYEMDDDFDFEEDLEDVRIDVNDNGFAPAEEHRNDNGASSNPRVNRYLHRLDSDNGSAQEGQRSVTSTSQRSQLSAQERAALDQQLIRSASQQHQHQQQMRPSSQHSDVPRSQFSTAPPVDMYDEKAENDRKRRQQLICAFGLIVVLILGIALGVGLALGLRNNNSGGDEVDSQSTNDPFEPRPTPAPTPRPTFSGMTVLSAPRSDLYDACDLLSVLQEGTENRCRSLCDMAVRCCNEDTPRFCKDDNRVMCEEYFGPCVALEVLGDR
uniref:Uncharacterized protein n=1 Tax=Minutocellus polymorphus TaxID=265543 RepID=A0A7S0ADU5_9STRA